MASVQTQRKSDLSECIIDYRSPHHLAPPCYSVVNGMQLYQLVSMFTVLVQHHLGTDLWKR